MSDDSDIDMVDDRDANAGPSTASVPGVHQLRVLRAIKAEIMSDAGPDSDEDINFTSSTSHNLPGVPARHDATQPRHLVDNVTASGEHDFLHRPNASSMSMSAMSVTSLGDDDIRSVSVVEANLYRDDVYNDLEMDDVPEPEADGLRGDEVGMVVREAAVEVIDRLLAKVDHHIMNVRKKRERLDQELNRELNKQNMSKRKVPVGLYLPPYFRNEHGRGPPLSAEAQRKRDNSNFDSLHKELKRWTDREIAMLREAVKEEFVVGRVQVLKDKLDIVNARIFASGVETARSEVIEWELEKEILERKINYIRQDDSVITADISLINWTRISSKVFKGARSPMELRLRWQNEYSPLVNTGPWEKEELDALQEAVKDKIGFVNWRYVATQLGTNRAPFAVFQKYKDDIAVHMMREWNREEDERLLGVVELVRAGDTVPWDKVCAYMPGRTRHQCKQRYNRSLDKSMRHGRWNEEEDLLLLCAVERFGTKAWHKVCKQIPGRSEQQCKDRWLNSLAVKTYRDGTSVNWTVEEDEKLLAGVEILGKSRWTAISDMFLVHRRPAQLRSRYLSLVTTKLRFSASQVELVRRTQQAAMVRQMNIEFRKEKVYQRFAEIFGTVGRQMDDFIQDTDDFHKDIRNKFPVQITEEEREQADKRRKEIEESYKNVTDDGTDAAIRVLDMINATEEDALDLEEKLSRRRRLYGIRPNFTIYRTLAPPAEELARKLRRPLAVPTKEYAAQGELGFAEDVTEEERVKRLYETLSQRIFHYDEYQFETQSANVGNQLTMMDSFRENVREALHDQEYEGEDNDITLPPNVATLNLLANMQKDRPLMLQSASRYFEPITVDVESVKEPSNLRRLHIPLDPKLTTSTQYQLLKSHMRCLLLEPLVFDMALTPENHDQILRRLETEEEKLNVRSVTIDESDEEEEEDMVQIPMIKHEIVSDNDEEVQKIHEKINSDVDTVMSSLFEVDEREERRTVVSLGIRETGKGGEGEDGEPPAKKPRRRATVTTSPRRRVGTGSSTTSTPDVATVSRTSSGRKKDL